jgi:hypothetical protein
MVARSDTVLYTESHRKWYVATLIISVIVFVGAALEVHAHAITGWEQRYMVDINNWPNGLRIMAVTIMLALSSLVSGSLTWCLWRQACR